MLGWLSKMQRYLGPNVYTKVPDGGWGWVVAVAFFFVEVYTYGVLKSFGVFLQDLMNHFGESNSRVSWILSICVFVMTFTAPLSSVMCRHFGYQPVVMLGGFLISLGTITSAFTNSINEMYITVGIISGLGYCLTFLPTVTILSHYFHKRRSLATAVASTGESLAIFAFAPAFTALKEHIGWQNCLVAIGVLQATIIVCGLLLRPIIILPMPTEAKAEVVPESEPSCTVAMPQPESSGAPPAGGLPGSPVKQTVAGAPTPVEKEVLMKEDEGPPLCAPERQEPRKLQAACLAQSRLLDFSVLKECSFLCYSLFGLFATLGFFAPQLYVIELSVSRGVEREHAAFMLSAMAVSEILGRFSIGWVLSRCPVCKLYVLLTCVLLLCAVFVAFTCVTHLWGLTACCVLYGFLFGTVASTHIPMLAEEDVVGVDRMSTAAGIYVSIQSFAGLAGPPLGGFLVDATKDYGSAFYSCAVGMAMGALFLGLVRPAKTRQWCVKAAHQQDCPTELCGESTSQDKDTAEVLLEANVALETSSPNRALEGSIMT